MLVQVLNKGVLSIMNILNLLLGEITQKELLDYYNSTILYEELPKHINGYVFGLWRQSPAFIPTLPLSDWSYKLDMHLPTGSHCFLII